MRFYLLIISLFFIPYFIQAQNARQTSQRSKAMKKASKSKRDAYTPTYHEKDSDGDGVPDGRDKCVNTPRGEKVTPFGCPIDTDFDGMYDYEDACVDVPGEKDNFGCPWGDRDSDGIIDKDDKCPMVAGIAKFEGCPDTDKDGLADYQDRCPDQLGPRENKGCPYGDRDLDGVSDDIDLCPDVFGVVTNRGCPEQKKEVEDILKKAFDNLLFETGKDVILSSSYPSLNELAAVMKKYPDAKLHLEGHTDDVGDDISNQELSENRAKAVKVYLTEKGVTENRITTIGYGETRPKVPNDDDDARRLNRRVEMNILYDNK